MKKLIIPAVVFLLYALPSTALAAPSFTSVSDNRSSYPGSNIPKYSKFEATFNVGTVARNFDFPFDPNLPPDANDPNFTKSVYHGISVDAIFISPSGAEFKQPAFYYQVFDGQIKNGKDWLYPTNQYKWKVRFSPNQVGTWQFRLTATDESGTSQTSNQSFNVVASNSKGLVKVSPTDPRYFEYDDGTYFPALGYSVMLDNVNPSSNASMFAAMNQNGISTTRVWISMFSIFGEAYGKWASPNRYHQPQEPRYGIVNPINSQFAANYPNLVPPTPPSGSEHYMWLESNTAVAADGSQQRFTPCRSISQIPVKQNTNYRLKVRYQAKNIEGPLVAGQPYGFTIKTTNSTLSNSTSLCNEPTAGNVIAATYNSQQVTTDSQNPGWLFLEGTYNSGASDFLPYLYLGFNNTKSQDSDTAAGHVFIDQVWMEESSCTSNCPNLIPKPKMDMHLYINQRDAYSFDKVVNLSEQYGIYLKAVMLEKNDRIMQAIGFDGSQQSNASIANFYGNRRSMTKVRWLQQAWWRYMQARWGYSPSIHSWELLNEGNSGNAEGHWDMADEFGKYMHCRVFGVSVSSVNPYQDCQYDHPNDHMVSTSFFNGGFPWAFWNNQSQGVTTNFVEMDYADQHYYSNLTDTSSLASYYDSAQFSYNLSLQDGTWAVGKRKPFMRGEVGWGFSGTDIFQSNSDNGEWLHDFIWAGLNSGGLMEHYFATGEFATHIVNTRYTPYHDHRPMFKTYYDFIKNIPLSNGRYQDVGAQTTNANIRAWGQKDVQSKRAHIWIANKNHTWKSVVDNTSVAPINTTVTVPGFPANTSLRVEWWNTYTGTVTQTQTLTTNAQGVLTLPITNLTTDVAVKIGDYNSTNTPPPTPVVRQGDVDRDGDVDLTDYNLLVASFNQPNSAADFNGNGIVDIFDYNLVASNFGN